MKKFISMIIAMLLVLSACFTVGCGKKDDDYEKRPNKTIVLYFNSGYGIKWLENCAKYYMDNVDTETYVEVRGTVLNAEEGQKVLTGLSSADLAVLQYAMHRGSGYLEDITDVYNSKAYGEEKTVAEKIEKVFYNYYNEGTDTPTFYQMPWNNVYGWAYVYNKTSLDEFFGENNYTLPRTTDELLELGDKLSEPETYAKDKNTQDMYLTALALYDSSDYHGYAVNGWVAQMFGYEAREQHLKGLYKFGDSDEWRIPTAAEIGEAVDASEYELTCKSLFDFMDRYWSQENGYAHSDSASMTFMDAQASLCGLGFGDNSRKVAFSYNGPWLEQEMEYLLTEAEATIGKQELRAMKLPIISAITQRKDFSNHDMTDEQLREAISYIDNGGKVNGNRPAFLNENDYNILFEARNFVTTNQISNMVIPKTAKNINGAKDFLRFLASDIAQELAIEGTGCITVLPYGKYTSEKAPDTEFIKSFKATYTEGVTKIIDHANLNYYFFAIAGSFPTLYTALSGSHQANYFSSTLTKTPDELWNLNRGYGIEKWQTLLNNYYAGIRK